MSEAIAAAAAASLLDLLLVELELLDEPLWLEDCRDDEDDWFLDDEPPRELLLDGGTTDSCTEGLLDLCCLCAGGGPEDLEDELAGLIVTSRPEVRTLLGERVSGEEDIRGGAGDEGVELD